MTITGYRKMFTISQQLDQLQRVIKHELTIFKHGLMDKSIRSEQFVNKLCENILNKISNQ